MNEKTSEKKVEIEVVQEQPVVVERPARLTGGLSVKSRVHAGKKAAIT